MSQKQTDREVMTRVNHAGEYGAVRIYRGQNVVFTRCDKNTAALTAEMEAHEQVHLDYFSDEITNKAFRPTVLLPLWHVGGFVLGAVTAALGRQAALACTQAVEEVIDHHYTNQIDELTEEGAFKEKLIAFRQDERDHHDVAAAENKQDYVLLRAGVGALCRAAIALSSRF